MTPTKATPAGLRAAIEVARRPNVTIASQQPVPGLPPSRWTQVVPTMGRTPQQVAASVVHALTAANPAPARVLLDELRGDSKHTISGAVRILARQHPELRGRWGVYLSGGSLAHARNLNDEGKKPQGALDFVHEGGGYVVAEMYDPKLFDHRVIDYLRSKGVKPSVVIGVDEKHRAKNGVMTGVLDDGVRGDAQLRSRVARAKVAFPDLFQRGAVGAWVFRDVPRRGGNGPDEAIDVPRRLRLFSSLTAAAHGGDNFAP